MHFNWVNINQQQNGVNKKTHTNTQAQYKHRKLISLLIVGLDV